MRTFIYQLFHVLVNGGIVLGIFVILLINNKRGRKTRANIFLSILLASLTFSIFHLRYAGEIINHMVLRVYSVGDPTFLLIAPLLWFYVAELTGERVKFGLKTTMHFLPFVVIVIFSLSFNTFLSANPLVHLFKTNTRLPFTIFWIMVTIQFTCYQYFVRKRWSVYRKIISQEVSNTEDVSISWVKFFISVFLVVNLFFLFGLFAVIHLNFHDWLWKTVAIVLAVSIFALGYKGILQREIFYTGEEEQIPMIPGGTQGKHDKPNQHLIDRVINFMEEKRPYLDPELSLSTLSKEIGLNRNQLSQLINDGLGQNFYDFVNKYRVEEVKRLMTDPDKKHYNLLGIAIEAGFKSKSTFNLIFKRFTGLTPTEYKKNII